MKELWLIYGLLSAVTAALVGIFGKLGLQGVDANTATAVRAIIMALFLIAVVFFQGNISQIPALLADKHTFFYILLSGTAGALSWLFYFLALKYGKVSQVAPIDKLSVVLATLIAIFFLGEKVSLLGGIGIALIGLGALLVAIG